MYFLLFFLAVEEKKTQRKAIKSREKTGGKYEMGMGNKERNSTKMSVEEAVNNFLQKMREAQRLAYSGEWQQSLDGFQSLAVELRKFKVSTPEDISGKEHLLKRTEKAISLVKQNIEADAELAETLRGHAARTSPEPPADPDVWSAPPSLKGASKPKKGTTAAATTSKSQKSSTTSTNPRAVPSTSNENKPANPSQDILPTNAAGEHYDASLYDPEVVRAVAATMESSKDNNMTMDKVIGMENVKQVLKEAIILPVLIPEFFTGLRRPWKAMCLAGPPGTGKTMIARAIAAEANSTVFLISSTDLTSKWRGDSEKILRLLFELARFYAPSIIFIDEIDTIATQRGSSGEHEASRRLKSELLLQMDGVKNQNDERRVFVLAATNLPWVIDEALIRRLEKRLFVPLPNEACRKQLIESSIQGINVDMNDFNVDEYARRTEGYSGADITSFCRAAAYNVLRRLDTSKFRTSIGGLNLDVLRAEPVRKIDFETALKQVSPTVNMEMLQKCEEWCDTFGSH
ncbi:unnamed protein product [Caenorhabditis angaria]|uniref:AAA+ ATPase domain-containing protein n=1 Tax=Caenorhabditis angaria TaxID=860376 RepID=A0A9P1ICH4_9PELO|nr:unnamed protein product [Caenorhabditis angaria]